MTSDAVIRLLQEGLLMILTLSAGPLLAALFTGLFVSILQAATQIQESTLSFVPKLLAVMLTLAILGSWMIDQSLGFVRLMFDAIASIQ